HLASGEAAKPFALELERHPADLVEEERPAAGGAHQARVGLAGPREGAAHVAEELALDELRADRRAVDGDELAAPAREAVHLGGDELLAGAGLADDERRRSIRPPPGAGRPPHLPRPPPPPR